MERHDDHALVIYTDGSCLSRPRRGGYAYRLVWIDADGEEQIYDSSELGFVNATNNEMELMAWVEALKLITGRHSPVPREAYTKVVVYSDSQYVLDNIYRAESVWPQNGWMTREGEPVLSPDLWGELVRQKQRAGRVEPRKVKAHKTNPHNRAVDKLAKESAKQAVREMSSPRVVRRKASPQKTEPRAVAMRGQIETIKVIVLREIRGRPYHAYKYEVVAPDSPDYERVDDAFARDGKVELRANHVYEVRFGQKGSGRWIEEVIREVVADPDPDPGP